jgi:putative transposase
VVHIGVTRHPTDAWVAQQLREATPFEQRPRYLIRDNDSNYGQAFTGVAEASGIVVLRTAYRTPKENAACERFLGSVRRECLDHLLVLGEAHLRRILREYVAYFNTARPHQVCGAGTSSSAILAKISRLRSSPPRILERHCPSSPAMITSAASGKVAGW